MCLSVSQDIIKGSRQAQIYPLQVFISSWSTPAHPCRVVRRAWRKHLVNATVRGDARADLHARNIQCLAHSPDCMAVSCLIADIPHLSLGGHKYQNLMSASTALHSSFARSLLQVLMARASASCTHWSVPAADLMVPSGFASAGTGVKSQPFAVLACIWVGTFLTAPLPPI